MTEAALLRLNSREIIILLTIRQKAEYLIIVMFLKKLLYKQQRIMIHPSSFWTI